MGYKYTQFASLDQEHIKYGSRIWRTQKLKVQAGNDLAILLQAFVPNGFHVRIEKRTFITEEKGMLPKEWACVGYLESIEGKSDAHCFAYGDSFDAVRARLLAYILDDEYGPFFPMT